MHSRRLLAALPLTVALAAGFNMPRSAHAQPANLTPGLAVESWGNYCAAATPNCTEFSGNYFYAEADAYSNGPASIARPDDGYVECDHAWTDTSGVRRYQESYAEGTYPNATSTSNGYVAVPFPFQNSYEGSDTFTRVPGTINMVINDLADGTIGRANGSQVTDNTQRIVVQGGMNISLNGTIYNWHYDTTTQRWVTDPSTFGSMSCATGTNTYSATMNDTPYRFYGLDSFDLDGSYGGLGASLALRAHGPR